jgi:hypothetical protein
MARRCDDTMRSPFTESSVHGERRRAPRYPFIATAEVVDPSTKASVTTRVSELSLYGCFVEMNNPQPEGTVLHIKIYSEAKFFEAGSKVIYSLPGQGIGVCFQDVRPQFLVVLKEWLILAARAKYGDKS